MKVCIAEKPSVAREIAEVLGATQRMNGYIEGNGYQVTWTFGHLCTLKEPHLSLIHILCCNPPIPNNFVFSPPIEGRWISWYVMAYGYDGFLRWAYDAWPEDADRDARHGSWAAGDCYMAVSYTHLYRKSLMICRSRQD